jgi:hypothetical protein
MPACIQLKTYSSRIANSCYHTWLPLQLYAAWNELHVCTTSRLQFPKCTHGDAHAHAVHRTNATLYVCYIIPADVCMHCARPEACAALLTAEWHLEAWASCRYTQYSWYTPTLTFTCVTARNMKSFASLYDSFCMRYSEHCVYKACFMCCTSAPAIGCNTVSYILLMSHSTASQHLYCDQIAC